MVAYALALVAFAEATMRDFEGEAMSTRVGVRLPDDESAAIHAAAVFTIFRTVEQEANEWRPGSPIAEVNAQAGGTPVAVPAGTFALVARGKALGAQTQGRFDITWAALWNLWDFRIPRLPAPAEVSARLPLVNYAAVELGEGTIRLPVAGMKLGLGGIAKGWALDQARDYLRQNGRVNFLIRAGGQVYAAGRNDQSQLWQVGVRNPDGSEESLLAGLAVTDASVSTTGDYERFFDLNGTRYHHVLDPSTGWPARGLRAVTVVSPDSTLADCASTALMVAGPTGAAAMARALGVEALWIDTTGMVFQTANMPVVWHQ
jgi:thiamine biosynthesis lipoprotein